MLFGSSGPKVSCQPRFSQHAPLLPEFSKESTYARKYVDVVASVNLELYLLLLAGVLNGLLIVVFVVGFACIGVGFH